MAAKLLHSLTDDNIDFEKQIGCMNGIFQLFDRHHFLTAGGTARHASKRDFGGDILEREASLRSSASTEKCNSHKNVQEKQRISTESSRASFSSLSPSSSFSSLDCNRATQLEPASFDRIIFPETPSMGLSPQFSKQSRDLRDLVKDSMYREIQGFSGKAKTADTVTRRSDSNTEEAPWNHRNEPRTLVRSSSYHSKDAPRFSYDASKQPLKLKDLPRLSLDSKAGSMRSLHDNLQARPPSVVAKLMGLDTLPDSISSHDNMSVSNKDFGNISEREAAISVQQSSKSPRWRSPDSSMKPPMTRFPIEPAPWRHIEGRSSRKPNKRAPARAETTFPSVYSEIEKRLKDLEFTQSAKDLRALKNILETMQSKGFLQTEKEVVSLDFPSEKEKYLNSKHEARSVDHRKSHSAKRRTGHIESPIVIMKPTKLVEKSVISVDGLPRTAKDLSSKHSTRDNAVKSGIMKNDRALKTTQTSRRSQQLAKDENVGSGKSISPRLQQKKIERCRPPMPPDSSKSRRQPQVESNSPGGRRRPRHPNVESRNMNDNSVQSNALVAISEKPHGASSLQSPCMKASEFMLSKNSTVALSEADLGEYSSPVSVLDDTIVHKHDSPSPVKYTRKTTKADAVEAGSCLDIFVSNSNESGMNRRKLEKIENLVEKLRRVNSSHDEARTDYIASLCENSNSNSNPDDRYISEILLASGLLLRGDSLTNIQFHPSGLPINPDLFLVLEQTNTTTLGKIHRKLIFDSVNELLAAKLSAKRAPNAQKLLRELCYEIQVIQANTPTPSHEDEDEDEDDHDKRWKHILYKDVMHRESESWINFDDEISGAVLDIERSIFKDLVGEIVIGDSRSK